MSRISLKRLCSPLPVGVYARPFSSLAPIRLAQSDGTDDITILEKSIMNVEDKPQTKRTSDFRSTRTSNSSSSQPRGPLSRTQQILANITHNLPTDGYVSFEPTPAYHLHCFAHKHNTHLTLTKPNRDPMISLSAGNMGFKKAKRGSYEAAFQLSAYVMRLIQERGYLNDRSQNCIQKLEITLRGFGPGRDAFSSVLLGMEGRQLRGRVTRVSDSTRLKIGGTRAPNPRRLG